MSKQPPLSTATHLERLEEAIVMVPIVGEIGEGGVVTFYDKPTEYVPCPASLAPVRH